MFRIDRILQTRLARSKYEQLVERLGNAFGLHPAAIIEIDEAISPINDGLQTGTDTINANLVESVEDRQGTEVRLGKCAFEARQLARLQSIHAAAPRRFQCSAAVRMDSENDASTMHPPSEWTQPCLAVNSAAWRNFEFIYPQLPKKIAGARASRAAIARTSGGCSELRNG